LHALLHPDCFDRLLAALRLDAPAKRLEVPEFQLRDSQTPEPPSGGQPPTAQLSEEDMQSLKESIIQERERRRRFSPAWLRIVVDRVELARWQLDQRQSGQIEIAPDGRLIEIYGLRDGEDMRLAAHLLSYGLDDQLRAVAATLTLEGGQELQVAVEPLSATGGEDAGATVAVSYRETAPLRVLSWRLRRLRERLFNPAQRPNWKPALAFSLLVLSGATLGIWLLIGQDSSINNLTSNATPTPQVLPPPTPTTAISPQPSPSATPTSRPSTPPPLSGVDLIAMDIRLRSGAPGETLTRSERTQAAGLLEAKKVYLDISGARREQVRQQLLRRLPSDNKFGLTEDPGEADVALKVTVEAAGQDRLALTAHLADANGKVIWPLTPGVIGRKYEGPLDKVIATFSRELAGDLRRLERQK
jgi:hypothetical protein